MKVKFSKIVEVNIYKGIIFLLLAILGSFQTSIQDQNISQIYRSNITFILFTLKKHQSYKEMPQIKQSIIKQINSVREFNNNFFQAQLSKNSYLTAKFNIKRFPYLAAIINLGQNTIYYKFKGVITNQSSINYIKKINNYMIYAYSQKKISLKNKNIIQPIIQIQFNSNKLNKQYLVQQYLFNDLFSQFYVILIDNPGIKNYQFYKVKYQYKFNEQQPQQFAQSTIQLKSISQSYLFNIAQQFSQQLYSVSNQFSSTQQFKKLKFVACLDTINQRDKGINFIKILNQLLILYKNQIEIYWMQVQINIHKKILLGFKQQDSLPLFTLFNPQQQNKTKITFKGKFQYDQMFDFINETIINTKSKWLQKINNINNSLSNMKIYLNKNHKIDQNYIVIKIEEKQIELMESLIQNIINSIERVNRFIYYIQNQIKIYVEQIKFKKIRQVQSINYKDKNLKLKINASFIEICEEITKNINISLPPQPCINEQSMQQHLYRKLKKQL